MLQPTVGESPGILGRQDGAKVHAATPPIPPPKVASSPADKRAAFGQGVCSRPSCGRTFPRRRAAGRAQRFCTVRCRRLADAEFRRAARSGAAVPQATGAGCVAGVSTAVYPPAISGLLVQRHRRGDRTAAADRNSPAMGAGISPRFVSRTADDAPSVQSAYARLTVMRTGSPGGRHGDVAGPGRLMRRR
jgi:hypothetical protein